MTRSASVFIVGAGRLGTALALAWQRAGVVLAGVWSRTESSALRSSALLDGVPVAQGPMFPTELGGAGVVVISVPDDVLTAAATALSGVIPSGVVVLHTSGVLDASALQPLRGLDRSLGSLHPLLSVSDPLRGAESLHGAYAAVEGDDAATEVALELARAAGLTAVRLPAAAQAKALYHAAAMLACNGLVALSHLSCELLGRAGVSAERAHEMLMPLLSATLANLEATGAPGVALTGPVRRGDVGTVQRHLEAFETAGVPELTAQAYRVLARAAVTLAAEFNPPLTEEQTAALVELLSVSRDPL